MWKPIMARPRVLGDSDSETGLNGPLEMLSNIVGPMPFGGNANIGGWLKEKDRAEHFMSEFSSDSRDHCGIDEEILLNNY